MTSYVFFAPGFEEIEALTPMDVLRRAGMEVRSVAVNGGDPVVKGAHGCPVVADMEIEDLGDVEAEWLIIPGGMPGASNLHASERLSQLLKAQVGKGGRVAAICASPALVLAPLGILDNRLATCYPGMSTEDKAIDWTDERVVVDGNVVTGNGPATALDFALTIVAETLGDEAAAEVASGMLTRF